jgi:DNA primase
MGIKDSTIERVRQLPISEVLTGEGIELKKIGREFVALCPWHNDSNPSLTVNDQKNLCFCFACGGGSDAIAFVEQKFSLSFADAIQRIAEKNGIQVEYDNLDSEEALRIAAQRRQLISTVAAAQECFRDGIRSDSGYDARLWLKARGIKPETSREFGLGWADSGHRGEPWNLLVGHLREKGALPVVEAGLAVRGDRGIYDCFRSRVMVPIHDHRGTLVGFTGRKISEDDQSQKYKNSPSSAIFDKGALIFNEHRAVEAARVAGFMVFVEGHFDVISMWQHGIKNVVATQGTAGPSLASIRRIMRHCRRFVLCYDGDGGGNTAIEAFIKVAGPLACQGEVTVTVAQLPEGSDPDSCIREGIDLYSIIEAAPQWLDWQIDCWLRNVDRTDTHHFSKVEAAVRSLVESIKSPALRQFYIDKAAKVLAEDPGAASKLAKTWSKSLPRLSHAQRWSRPVPAWVRSQVERRVLRLYVHCPSTRDRLRPLMGLLEGPSHIWLWNRLTEIEQHALEVTPELVLALLAVCEPHYTRTLRAIAVPTIKVIQEDGIMEHAEKVLAFSTETSQEP